MKTQRILQLISKLTTKGLPGIFVGLVAMLAAVLYSGAALADVSQATIRGTITLDGQTAPADTAVTGARDTFQTESCRHLFRRTVRA